MFDQLAPPPPCQFGHFWALHGKPPLNGGGAKKPDPPPPAPAPFRADAVEAGADAARLAARRKGLRRTFLRDLMASQGTPAVESPEALGVPTLLGRYLGA